MAVLNAWKKAPNAAFQPLAARRDKFCAGHGQSAATTKAREQAPKHKETCRLHNNSIYVKRAGRFLEKRVLGRDAPEQNQPMLSATWMIVTIPAANAAYGTRQSIGYTQR